MHTQHEIHNTADARPQVSRSRLLARKQSLILSAIAMLSDHEIRMMSRQDLLDALRMAQSASPQSQLMNIADMEVAELRRVLAIVREYFRNQEALQSRAKTWKPEFN